MSLSSDIKTMKLYPEAERIFRDLESVGISKNEPINVDLLSSFDQLHYHGVETVLNCITTLNINSNDNVLEIGSGWGGPARYIADRTNAHVVALELQKEYHEVGLNLTKRCGLHNHVEHTCINFLNYNLSTEYFDKIVSWLALYHIPNRAKTCQKMYSLLKPGGRIFIEDLVAQDLNANVDWNLLKENLFSNSLILTSECIYHLEKVGFKIESQENMTSQWLEFTKNRLQDFLNGQVHFTKLHNPQLFNQIEQFYQKIVEYFEAKAIGGVRLICSRPI